MNVIDLRSLKLPVNQVITLDFETYYGDDYTLSKMTTEAYVRDLRFEVIGVGVLLEDGRKYWFEANDFAVWARGVDWSKIAVLCHHAHFDGFILAERFGIRPGFWLDTLSMARALLGVEVGGSLAKVMQHFGVGEKGHEVVLAKGKRRKDFTALEWTAYGNYCLNDCQGTSDIFGKMARALPVSEFFVIDFTVRQFTEPRLIGDTSLLRDALAEEQHRKAELLARSGADRDGLMSADKFAELLERYGAEVPVKWSEKQEKEIPALAKTDPGFQALLDHPKDEIRWLAEARLGVKSTINESRIGRFIGMSERGPIPVYLKYSGAHTHRWSGGDKVNFQNLPRGGVLRKSLCAPAWHKLIACDSAQIEARGVAWLAGDQELLADFRNKVDVYSKFASEIYGRPIDRKKVAADEVPGFIGKVCVLGLGYGMGWKKFASYLLSGPLGGPPVKFSQTDAELFGADTAQFEAEYGDDVAAMVSRLELRERISHCAAAKSIVDRYRRVRSAIPALWRAVDKFIPAMTDESRWGQPAGDGPLSVLKIHRHAIELPNGMRLRYPGLRKGEDGYTYLSGHAKRPSKIYGGLLVENIVQALARVIIAEQAVSVTLESNVKLVTTTHDELVFVTQSVTAADVERAVVQIMSTPLWWCPDWPLAAEAGSGERYGDC